MTENPSLLPPAGKSPPFPVIKVDLQALPDVFDLREQASRRETVGRAGTFDSLHSEGPHDLMIDAARSATPPAPVDKKGKGFFFR